MRDSSLAASAFVERFARIAQISRGRVRVELGRARFGEAALVVRLEPVEVGRRERHLLVTHAQCAEQRLHRRQRSRVFLLLLREAAARARAARSSRAARALERNEPRDLRFDEIVPRRVEARAR